MTCDETWVHQYTTKSKQASHIKDWRKKGEGVTDKSKTLLSAGKVFALVFWDFKGVLHIDFLQERRTINAAYYCNILDEAKVAYWRKRRGFSIRNFLLLFAKMPVPHTAKITREKTRENVLDTIHTA